MSWLATFVLGAAASVFTLLTLGLFSRRFAPWILRVWGRTLLKLAGVTWELQGAEHVNADAMKVVVFNHASLLDGFLVTAIMPPSSTAAIKHEMLYYPVVGLAVYLLRFLTIDRGSSARAKRTMNRAASRMAKERLTVFIAPEGTRSKTGEVQAFKKGSMHLALNSKAPIVPMVIDGAYELHGPGKLASKPGHIVMRALPPRSTEGLTAETIGEETEALRELIIRELARLRAERQGEGLQPDSHP